MNIKIEKINNIDTILINIPTNSLYIWVYTKAWSIYEKKEKNWIAHLLEHMFFKWSKNYPNTKAISETIENIGWYINAYTWYYNTCYYIKIPYEYFEIWIKLLADMLINPLFKEDELEKEKEVVIQEMKMYEDDPKEFVFDKFFEFYYWDTPYWRPIIWKEESVKSITRDDLIEFKDWLYTKDNIAIVICWNIKDEKILLEVIYKEFKNMKDKKYIEKPQFFIPKHEKNYWMYNKWTNQAHIIIAYPWYNIFDDNKYKAKIIANIFWWKASSILFQKLRDELGLCYYINMEHIETPDDWIYLIRTGVDKNKVEEVLNLVDEILNKKVWENEIINAKNNIKWNLLINLETSSSIWNFIWSNYILTWKIITIDDIVKKIDSTTIDNINFNEKYYYYII